MVISHPADWIAEDASGRNSAGDGAYMTVVITNLRHAPAHGLQKWIEEGLYQVTDQTWASAELSVALQKVSNFSGLDAEQRRLEPILRMLASRSGESYSMRRSACPIGEVLEIETTLTRPSGLQTRNSMLVFPRTPAGQQQYELILGYVASEKLKARLHQVSRDVVSRIKLVKELERPSP